MSRTHRSQDRAVAVDAELRQRATRLEHDFLTFCELAQEAMDGAYHTRFGFADFPAYCTDRLGFEYRTLRKRLAAVEALRALPAGEQNRARSTLAAVGATKASILAPALRRDPAGWADWCQKAAQEPAEALQARVSRALGLRPRGPVAMVSTQKGEGWYRAVLAGLPDDLQEQTQRAFKLAERALEKADPSPYECWGALVEEFIATWEPKA